MAHHSHPHHSHAGHPAGHGQHHYPVARAQTVAAIARHVHHTQQRAGSGYAVVCAGRQVRIGPVAFWIVVGTLVIMAAWSVATGTYFAFSNDVLTRLIGRQAEMQFAYEDRIAELRAQVDRVTSRQLLDQEQFEKKLNALLQRQSAIEQRSSALPGDMPTGSVRPSRLPPAADDNRLLRPSPINDTVIFTAPPDREARLESRELPTSATRFAERSNTGGLDGMLARVSLSLDKVELRQTAALTDLEEQVDNKARRMAGVLSDLGVDVAKSTHGAAMGGPFVPLKAPQTGASAFERQLYRINLARAQISRYTQALAAVPVRKPVIGEVDMSSPFGMRMDPFLKGPAIHTGIDLRGEKGDPVRVTANGRVTIASWQGGYGNMVEVDHGNGLATRYGHLSAIDVQVGQTVHMGQVIGKIGSTGRSTGPHLHYETRVDGEAVDPQKFLRAGVRLGSSVLGNAI
jgi:murein DD-endopeptidase MepM/ murein hydrolase activator NlpD